MATVLVTDDDTESLEAARAAIRGAGHAVLAVTTAREALIEIARTPIDVLITDLSMQDMSGLELCERIVGNRPDVPGGGHHRARQPRDGRRGDPRRRLRLHAPSRSTPAACSVAVDRACATSRAPRGGEALAARVDDSPSSTASSAQSPAMQRVLRPGSSRRRHRRVGAHHRRERHRQGAGRARAPRAQPRGAPARSSRSTAPRCPRRCSRASCSATRAAPSPTPRQRARACSRRRTAARSSSTRSASMPLGAAAEAPARAAGAHGPPGRRRPPRSRSTCASSPRPTAISRRAVEEKRFREDLYYRINVVHVDAAAAARARQRRPAPRAALRRRASPRAASKPVRGIARGRGREARSPTTGRATCASWRTASSARWRSPASTRSRSTTCPRRSAQYSPTRTSLVAATIRPSCSRSRRSSAATSCACSRRSAATRPRAARLLGLDRKTLYRKLEWLRRRRRAPRGARSALCAACESARGLLTSRRRG